MFHMAPPTLLLRLSSGLTERRLRVHGLLLGACLWSIYAFDIATPGLLDRNGLVKGTDFVHFYVLGTLAREHRGAALYDVLQQAVIAQEVVPETRDLYFVALYGPQVSLFFAPLARLPYGWAFLTWSLFNTLVYAVCCYAIWKTCLSLREYGGLVAILAIAYPAFFHLIAWGQTTAPALAIFTLAYFALRSQRQFLAGLAIGLLVYKPQLGIVPALLFLFSRQWSAVGGVVISAVSELAIGWTYYGSAVMRDYTGALRHLRKVLPYLEPRPYTAHSLREFWAMLIPATSVATVLYFASAVVVLAITVRIWRSDVSLTLRYSALLVASVLVAPHLAIYDLVILAPAFLLLSDWGTGKDLSGSSLPLLLYLCYALPLVGPLSRYTHVQLSVVAFAGLAFFLWRRASRESAQIPA